MDYLLISLFALLTLGYPIFLLVKGVVKKNFNVSFYTNASLLLLGLFTTLPVLISGYVRIANKNTGVSAGTVEALVSKMDDAFVYAALIFYMVIYVILMLVSRLTDWLIKKAKTKKENLPA